MMIPLALIFHDDDKKSNVVQQFRVQSRTRARVSISKPVLSPGCQTVLRYPVTPSLPTHPSPCFCFGNHYEVVSQND